MSKSSDDEPKTGPPLGERSQGDLALLKAAPLVSFAQNAEFLHLKTPEQPQFNRQTARMAMGVDDGPLKRTF